MIKLTLDKNDKNMVTNWGCNYNKMVILTGSFRLFKLGFNHVMWSASFNVNLKEGDAESIMAKQFSSHTFLQAEFSNKCLKFGNFCQLQEFINLHR